MEITEERMAARRAACAKWHRKKRKEDPEYVEKQRAKSRAHYYKNKEKMRQYTKDWRLRNIDRARELARKSNSEWLAIPENRIKHCLGQAKRRARDAGMLFDVTIDDLLPLPVECPVLGIKINYCGTKARGFVNDCPSVDRVDSSLGYVRGNVRIISWRANRIKSDASIEELSKVLDYMITHKEKTYGPVGEN